MAIKKATRISILAIAAVAIMGIATVSFAAWATGDIRSITAQAYTGHVDFIGFVDGTQTTQTIAQKLVPFDQQTYDSTESNPQVKMLEITVPDIRSTKNVDINVKFADSANKDLTVYAKVSNGTVSLPATKEAITTDKWTQVDAADNVFASVNAADVEVVTGYKLYVILDSSLKAHMGQKLDLVVTLTEHEGEITEPAA